MVIASGAKQSRRAETLGLLARLGDCGRPGRHDVADAVIEAVLAAQHEGGAGKARGPARVLDQRGAGPPREALADRLGEAAVDRDAALAADIDARMVRGFLG